MRIGVNTRLLIDGKMDGIGWFACESLRRITAAHPEHDFYFFFDRKPSEKFIFSSNVTPIVLLPQARHPVLWYLFFEWSLPYALRRHKIDLLLSPDGYIPLEAGIPTLSVIHDLNFEHAKENLKPSHQRYMKHYFPRFAQRATRIATVSNFSRRDIAKTYAIDEQKIDVVYNGSQTSYSPLREEQKTRIRQQFSDGKPFFLFVSTILKRKNLANLLTAFDAVMERYDVRLVVVGSRVWWQDELQASYDNMLHKDAVHFLGHLEVETLAQLMSSAVALVYPSFFEGFGIPIVEAFYAETPVITSNATSMPEVAGDAALLIDPHNPKEIADAMTRIIDDPALRDRLIEFGRTQRKKFSWERTASLLWESMMNTYNNRENKDN